MRHHVILAALGLAIGILAAEVPVAAAPVARAYPNPAHGTVHVRFTLNPVNFYLRATVRDVSGHLIRILHDGPLLEGEHGEISWDGLTTTGQRVPSGFYFIRIDENGRVSVVKTWIIR
jgi:hypothetical protein